MVVLVISDGRPTAGVRDGRTIINALTSENQLRNAIFAFGGGKTANRPLLDLLAYRNKGEAYISPSTDRINTDLPGFFDRVSDPILVDCNARFGRIDEKSVFPQ